MESHVKLFLYILYESSYINLVFYQFLVNWKSKLFAYNYRFKYFLRNYFKSVIYKNLVNDTGCCINERDTVIFIQTSTIFTMYKFFVESLHNKL